jgi:hypothetical protein
MEQFLTIDKIKDSGKVDNFGNHKCYISLTGHEDEVTYTDVYAAFKDLPTEGTIRYGSVQDGEYGQRFKSAQVPDGVQRPAGMTSAAKSAPQSASKAPQGTSYNQDGARQGMAINNAATYVIAQLNGDRLSPEDFASEIQEYAKAIYKIDLTASVEDDVMAIMSA